jgi:hypothetical protein
MSLGQPIMSESKSIQLLFDADVRFAAAVGGVARYLADSAGLEGEVVSQLQSAAIAACQDSFEHLTERSPKLGVTLSRTADRIEIAISHQGTAAPSLGLDTIAGFGAHAPGGGTLAMSAIDRVQFETRGNSAVTRLTKFLHPRVTAE